MSGKPGGDAPFPRGERIGDAKELAAWFERYCVAPEERRIGIEVEKLGLHPATRGAIPYSGDAGLEPILERFAATPGWQALRETGHIVQIEGGGRSLNLEPGSQLELSGCPAADLHAVRGEVNEILALLDGVTRREAVAWIGYGIQPFSDVDEIEWIPRARYRLMSARFERTGRLGHRMMKQTASIQASFNYVSEADAVSLMRLAIRLSPVATAMFANSPISRGRPNGFLSRRAAIWSDTDPRRCGFVAEVLDGDRGFADYVDYALAVPMLFLVREGRWIPLDPIPFGQFLKGGVEGHRAVWGDWELHLTTLFPDVRLKNIVEVRNADAQRPSMTMSVPAFWKGILYDRAASDEAAHRVKGLGRTDLERLAAEVPLRALRAEWRGRPLRDLAVDLIAISRRGLSRQGRGEEVYLEPLEALVVGEGISPAREVLRRWESGWKAHPEAFIEFHRY